MFPMLRSITGRDGRGTLGAEIPSHVGSMVRRTFGMRSAKLCTVAGAGEFGLTFRHIFWLTGSGHPGNIGG